MINNLGLKFISVAKKNALKPAILFKNKSVTFKQLDNLSNNGNILKKLIIEFFSLVYPNSINWINNNVKLGYVDSKSIKPSLLTFKYVTLKPFSDKFLQDSRTHLCSVTQVII